MYVLIHHLPHLLLLLVLSLLDHAYAQIDIVGSSCTLSSGRGVCELINDCQPIYNDMLAGIPPEKFCGYNDTTLTVCCPVDKSAITSTTTQPIAPPTNVTRISTQMCAHYAEKMHILRTAPILIGGDEPLVSYSFDTNSIDKTLIVGGDRAEPMEFPHMAAIGYNRGSKIRWDCGGSLISESFVLTAAHCTISPRWGDAHWVRVGDLNLRKTSDNARPQDRRIIERIRHPKYKVPAQYNDIALLKLQLAIRFTPYVMPACLSVVRNHPENFRTMATGWGIVEWTDSIGSEDLMKVTLPIVGYEKCASYYTNDTTRLPKGIKDRIQLCAGIFSKDTCQGDSGGPLIIFSATQGNMYDIIGVTSFGQVCASVAPGIYTRIYPYLSWIESTVWPFYS